jgi:hypothetical protein
MSHRHDPFATLAPERTSEAEPDEQARRLAAGLTWFGRALPTRMFESALRLLQRPGSVPALPSEIEVRGAAPASAPLPQTQADAAPSLEVYLLSPFSVFANDRAITDWPNCKGKAIFKYLATHRAQPVPKEVLMEVFWPQAEPDAARNNLNVAIYGLRRARGGAPGGVPLGGVRPGGARWRAPMRSSPSCCSARAATASTRS